MRKGFIDPSSNRYPHLDQLWLRVGLCKNNGSVGSHVDGGDSSQEKSCAGLTTLQMSTMVALRQVLSHAQKLE